MLTGVSRSVAARAIIEGQVTVDGEAVAKVSQRLLADQRLEIDDSILEDDDSIQADSSVEVVASHVDDDVIVIDKSPGSVVHPGAGNDSGTIIQGVMDRYPEVASIGDPARPGVVHRLDKGTSGVFVIARSQRAYESLTRQLKERTVERTYLTVGWGQPSSDKGVIEAPIGRAVRDPTRMVVHQDGKPARTAYTVLARWHSPDVTLFSCTLDTGRTHQIRVHLEAIHHPVVGDRRYGGGRDTLGMDRPALHAAKLGFVHPATGELVRFESSLPDDLRALFHRVGAPEIGEVPSE